MPTLKFSSTYQPYKRQAILTESVRFYVTPEMLDDLRVLSRHVQRHPADLCREALRQFVDYYKAHPEELTRG